MLLPNVLVRKARKVLDSWDVIDKRLILDTIVGGED